MTNTQAEVLDQLIPLLVKLHDEQRPPEPSDTDSCVCCEVIKRPRPVCLCAKCNEEAEAAWLRILLGIPE